MRVHHINCTWPSAQGKGKVTHTQNNGHRRNKKKIEYHSVAVCLYELLFAKPQCRLIKSWQTTHSKDETACIYTHPHIIHQPTDTHPIRMYMNTWNESRSIFMRDIRIRNSKVVAHRARWADSGWSVWRRMRPWRCQNYNRKNVVLRVTFFVGFVSHTSRSPYLFKARSVMVHKNM